MKILWFSPISCNLLPTESSKIIFGGWIESLRQALKNIPGLELEIAFLSDNKGEEFIYEGIKYYPIWNRKSHNPFARVFDRFRNSTVKYLEFETDFLNIAKKSHPDLIHIHGTDNSYGSIISSLKEELPIVVSVQGLTSIYEQFYFKDIQKKTIQHNTRLYDKIRMVDESQLFKNFKVRSCFEKEFLQNVKYVMGRTDFDRRATFLFNPNRKYYTVNEIMRTPFYEANWKNCPKGDVLKITSTISCGTYKGLETVFAAASILEQHYRGNFEWQIIGYDGSEQYVSFAARELSAKIPNSVKFMGVTNAGDLATILSESDIYVQVSHIENSPNSLCEAMLVGVPAVATFAGGTSSILVDKEEGILVQDRDAYSIAAAIIELASDFNLACNYSARAKSKASARNAPGSVAKELIKAYSEIIADFYKYDERA